MTNHKNLQTENKTEKTIKKSKNELECAKENLDIPGSRTARPLTNDRHSEKLHKKTSKTEPIENIELDTDPGKEK